MLKTGSAVYQDIRDYLEALPVIDTHEHYIGNIGAGDDLFGRLLGYFVSDLITAAGPDEQAVLRILYDGGLPFDERYDVFEKYWRKANKTAYIKSLMEGFRRCWGIEEVSREAFRALHDKLPTRDMALFESLMDSSGIRLSVVNIGADTFRDIVDGKNTNFSPYCRFAFPLPEYHDIHSAGSFRPLETELGRGIVTLDDYVAGFDSLLGRAVDFGAVCLKDQSAYRRTIDYGHPTKAEAEKVFQRVLSRPRDTFGSDEVKPLDDWLFGHFMTKARDYGLPVQLHTGHMAGNRNDVRKANASHLIPLLELHKDVRFALFHGNWPYMDEYLFIGKNFPNVYLDLCWTHIIDPIYSIELMKRAVMTVPHSKVLAFGGDCFAPEQTVGYLAMARDNTACALADLVDCGWLSLREAKEIAADWFFNNPTEFFGFGFDRIEV